MNFKTTLCTLILSCVALGAVEAQGLNTDSLEPSETSINVGATSLSGEEPGLKSLIAESDSIVQKEDAAYGKKSNRRKIQRINRGIRDKVFIPKGTWMAGGTVSYNDYNQDNYNLLVLKDVTGEGYRFKLSPYVGYFIKDNVAVGIRFQYSRTYLDYDNFNLDLGDDLNITLTDTYYLKHTYEIGGFLRTFMPVGNSKIFGFFNDTRLTYAHSTGKDSTGSGTEYDGTFATNNSIEIGIAPGLTAFITDWAAIEVSLNMMGFKFKWEDQKTNQVEDGSSNSFSGNFKINLFSINIGMTFYL